MEKLNIFLALSGNSPVCYPYSTTPDNSTSKLIAGTKKLLELIELHLELSQVFPSRFERILALKERLSQLPEEQPSFLCSFIDDALVVSKRILNFWDT